MSSHGASWSHDLFVEHPELFLPVLEGLKSQSSREADGLCSIFDLLSIPHNGRILDFSCGIGRHSIQLAKRGYTVIGYDPSPLYVCKAKSDSESEGLGTNSIKFYEGKVDRVFNILSRYGQQGFDAIIIMYNSFGYSTEKEDVEILKQLKKLGTPSCLLVIETENRDWTLRNFLPFVHYELKDIEIYEDWSFNLERSTAESRSKFYRKNGTKNQLDLELDIRTSLRLYSLHELKNILENSGWTYIKSYGSIQGLDGTTVNSQYIVTIGRC